ncbi:tetratricopeptide repeat protein [Methylophilaceae bacterium]|jgi:predicted TPR repeat methyltransferase|nr:tetratricopeptide repeat protein [Methylophilaceae bacterium]|tara:strand:+ start:846 stop:2171 length:1326 start_codon:yes stop_codon:yes gene_type:complete
MRKIGFGNVKKKKDKGPSPEELNSLLSLYQNGQFEDAEHLAISITKKFPKHIFSWKVLGVILKNTGRASEALIANKKAVVIDPQDVESYNNMGNTLQELGRLKEAESSYRQAISLKSNFAEAHNNLGNILKDLSRLKEAESSYRQAISLKSDYAEAHNNLGAVLKEVGKFEEAIVSYEKAIALKPNFAIAYGNMGAVLKDMGRSKEAIVSYEKALKLMPNFSEAEHWLAALKGETTSSAPKDYVEKFFDQYANKFEHSLVEQLQYNIPKIITKMIVSKHPNSSLGSILDLGCGTGLAGVEIKEFCTNLEGIDLSRSMLEKAREKNIYAKLTHGDILDYLLKEDLDFDYFISTDTFVYLGDLSDVFRLLKSRNKSGGKLVFSTEHLDKGTFILKASGRYSHSKSYIESLCKKFSYKLSYFKTAKLRKEKNDFLTGGLYLLEF